MNNKLNLDPDKLDIEYNMLLEELKDLEDIYTSSNNVLKNFTKMQTRSSPTFIANQTANLISIKEKKLNVIKELTNIKKSKMDIEAKMFTANNKLEDQNTGISKDILDLYRLLNKADKSVLIEDSINNEEEQQMTNTEIDNILNSRLSEGKVEQQKETKKKQVLPEDYSIVCTKDKQLFIIDSDYNIIDDCEFDTSVINIIRFDTVEDEEFAYDEDNNRYEVVEI